MCHFQVSLVVLTVIGFRSLAYIRAMLVSPTPNPNLELLPEPVFMHLFR
jgi:hypothetical protein